LSEKLKTYVDTITDLLIRLQAGVVGQISFNKKSVYFFKCFNKTLYVNSNF